MKFSVNNNYLLIKINSILLTKEIVIIILYQWDQKHLINLYKNIHNVQWLFNLKKINKNNSN